MEIVELKIGFLFNHDQIHQIAHSLPIAKSLASMESPAEIIIATTSDRLLLEVERLMGDLPGTPVQFKSLKLTRRSSKVLRWLAGNIVPAAKLLIYRDNLDFFKSLDVLVVPDKTSLVLKSRYGLGDLKIIHTRHGAGDRAIGFDRASERFDHILVPGPKVRDRLVAETRIDPSRVTVVGYPKFDLFAESQSIHPIADTGRPVVIYNPHVSPHLSSWYKMGRQVLDWFANHEEYQLIFAPHIMLFERPYVVTIDRLRIDRPGWIEDRHLRAPNIHIDIGSRTSTTMAYLNRADIYLGDVSSQVYEFLLRRRPCLFLNPHRFAWQGDPNFAFWAAGPVIEGIGELGDGLVEAQRRHKEQFRTIQTELFNYTFDLSSTPSSVRAANAVAKVAGLQLTRSKWPLRPPITAQDAGAASVLARQSGTKRPMREIG